MSFLLSTYYNVIIAWVLYYLVYSFYDPIPWKDCGNEWNSADCWNGIHNDTSANETRPGNNSSAPAQEFYE